VNNFWLFIQLLPDLLKLIRILKSRLDEAETDRKVKDDIKKIHDAFASGDASKLNELFKQPNKD
jgi:hypothetical protein